MHPSYRPSHHHPQFMSAVPCAPTATHAFRAPYDQPLLPLDEMIRKRYTENEGRLRDAISRSWFPNPGARQACSDFVRHLRIHRNLFMYTYVHVVSCCRGRYLQRLENSASLWKGWGSVQQLTHHLLIKEELLSFCVDCPCRQHGFLLAQPLVISDDDSDLLCHLLYCSRKSGLYELPDKPTVREHGPNEPECVIELLWQFLTKPQESNIARRLRGTIFRMARKYAYLPRALWIVSPSTSNKQDLVAGANGWVTKARMGGNNVVIKKIVCGDHATQRKCLQMFASEAILWKTLRHQNIVPFLGIIAESPFDMGLVSPFFKNGNVRNYMKRCQPREWPALARRWGKDLAQGLEYIHRHEPPIIHGDLKGDNVLVDDDNHARLGDFGQSYASDSGKYLDSTRVGRAAYSPVHWMAPEIMLAGEGAKTSDKSDIYSFGCVLYEMMSGKIPFEGFSFGDIVKRVTNGGRPNLPESISKDHRLWKIAESCWENRPEARSSATRLVSLLP